MLGRTPSRSCHEVQNFTITVTCSIQHQHQHHNGLPDYGTLILGLAAPTLSALFSRFSNLRHCRIAHGMRREEPIFPRFLPGTLRSLGYGGYTGDVVQGGNDLMYCLTCLPLLEKLVLMRVAWLMR